LRWAFLLSRRFHVRWSTTKSSGKFMRYLCMVKYFLRIPFQNWAYPSGVSWGHLGPRGPPGQTPLNSMGTISGNRFSPGFLKFETKLKRFHRLPLQLVPFMFQNWFMFHGGHVNTGSSHDKSRELPYLHGVIQF
jgi:hypothetical protein